MIQFEFYYCTSLTIIFFFLFLFTSALIDKPPNLPYLLQGRNSILYSNENERILRSVRSQIETGTPCAFVTRPSNSGEDKGPSLLFESTGFDVLGQAFVPQREFLLPAGKKKGKKPQNKNSDNGDSDSSRTQNQCVITIARAKEYK